MKFQLYTDGGSRGNPGPSAYAYIICDGSGREVASRSDYLGIGTNNEAEYRGLLNGLKEVLERGGTEVEVFMDSELVINQLKGRYRVKARAFGQGHPRTPGGPDHRKGGRHAQLGIGPAGPGRKASWITKYRVKGVLKGQCLNSKCNSSGLKR
jgi:hypothetical protein